MSEAPASIPHTTVERLPSYLRVLLQARADGVTVVKSGGIADLCGSNAAQVRKDLSYLGELGRRGVGYDVEALIGHMTRVLGLARNRKVGIVGFGRLGGALTNYLASGEHPFDVVSVIDVDPARIGERVGDLRVEPVADLEAVLARDGVEIAVITAPAEAAPALAERACSAGVRCILNFAPTALDVPDAVAVRNVDLSAELQILSFHLTNAAN